MGYIYLEIIFLYINLINTGCMFVPTWAKVQFILTVNHLLLFCIFSLHGAIFKEYLLMNCFQNDDLISTFIFFIQNINL